MVSLVIQRHYVLDAHEFRHDPLEHLSFGFQGIQGLSGPLQQRAPSTGNFEAFAGSQGMVVGDDDLGPVEVFQHIGGDQFPAGVVAVGVIWLEHPQPVFDGEAGGDHQETASEPTAVGMPDGVDGLPSDNHCHDGGLASASGQLQGDAK